MGPRWFCMTDKPGRHYRCSSCQETPKTDSLHPQLQQGREKSHHETIRWAGVASSSCVTVIQPSEEITNVLIILHCNPLFATRQEMLLSFHVQTPGSKDVRRSPEEVGGSSGNAVPESWVQLILQYLSSVQMPQKVWRFYFSLGHSPKE